MELWMLCISWVGIQNWWKSTEFHLPFCKCSLSFFSPFCFSSFFVVLIFHTRWQCLSTSAWQGNWFNLSGGEEILLFHVSFYIYSLKNYRWETGFWWATYGWAKKSANFFPHFHCTNGSLLKLIEPGWHWLDVRWAGAVFQCCPQGIAFIETSSEKLYWVGAESAARLGADCLAVLSHMLSILRSQWEKTQLPSLSKKTKCWRGGGGELRGAGVHLEIAVLVLEHCQGS